MRDIGRCGRLEESSRVEGICPQRCQSPSLATEGSRLVVWSCSCPNVAFSDWADIGGGKRRQHWAPLAPRSRCVLLRMRAGVLQGSADGHLLIDPSRPTLAPPRDLYTHVHPLSPRPLSPPLAPPRQPAPANSSTTSHPAPPPHLHPHPAHVHSLTRCISRTPLPMSQRQGWPCARH